MKIRNTSAAIFLLLVPFLSCRKSSNNSPNGNDPNLIIFAGGYHSLIVKSDNSLLATGDNAEGQLGDSTAVAKFSFVKVFDNVKIVGTGKQYSLIVRTDNSL